MSWKRIFAALLAAAVLFVAPRAFAETWRSHFDADGASRPPGFFDFVTLGAPGPANWMVLADRNPPSAPNQVTQTYVSRPDGSMATALRRNVAIQDGRVSVSIKKIPSHAGVALRVKDERNFVVLLLDATSGEAKLTSWRDGKATVLAQGKAEIDREWGILSVKLAGKSIAATWNQKPLLEGQDPRPASGRAGIATEGAGNASFDEFVIESP